MQELAMLGLVRPTLPVASWLMPRRRGHHDQAHRLLCLLLEYWQTLCLVNSVFDGNREFPSIATKTRPTNDALMGYSVDVT
jgi:hypothetical protein